MARLCRRAGTRLERHVSLHGVELLPCGVCVAAAVGVREAHTAVARCAQPAAKAAPHPRQAALGSLLQLADRAIGAFLRTRASFTSMCARPITAPAEALSAAHALWPLSLCPLLSASLQDSTSVRWRGRAGQRSGVNVCDRTRAEGSCGTGRVAWQGGAIGMHGSWTVTHRRGLVPQLLRHRAVAGHLRRWTRGEVSTHHRPCCCTRHQPSRCSGRYRGMRSAARLE